MLCFKSKAEEHATMYEMFRMAKLFQASNSIDEFLVRCDLEDFKRVSTQKWQNPFAIYGMAKRCKALRLAFFIGFPLMIIAFGLLQFAFPECLLAKIAIASIQGALLLIQLQLSSKELDARMALSEVESAELDARFAKLAKALGIPSTSSQQTTSASNV